MSSVAIAPRVQRVVDRRQHDADSKPDPAGALTDRRQGQVGALLCDHTGRK